MKELQTRFLNQYPQHFFLSYNKDILSKYLIEKQFLFPEEQIIKLEKPGEGNMNFVLRVITNKRNFIIKQARPWVEKYPQIDAPVSRNEVEASFYSHINRNKKLKAFSPELLYSDKGQFVSIVSDLGEGSDFSFLYKEETRLTKDELQSLVAYISILHHLNLREFPENREMKILNHFHIFDFPFQQNNQFDLEQIQTGLQQIGNDVKSNTKLVNEIEKLGKLYLSSGNVLIHGDYYPGSWLKSDSGIKVIDPEFSFLGLAEFDLGVLLAHIQLTKQEKNITDSIIELYDAPAKFDLNLVAGFAGTEILRRLLGVAQLPVNLSLDEKEEFVQKATKWILEGKLI